ncbi:MULTISPECIES: hypothetical protein [Burkholderia]|uniref:Uncharacterized protein n=2 Tax=Burkholderia contaminans TaxID=488447 RepID=A0A1E3FFD8_9BURK|nr:MULTISPECIES: hypothetical protein [Burkholderia]EKS9794222.1 hypothetical protein [Burkholderia cepacia]UTP24157.1 hypothetical protein NMB33_26870 [Burkholderia sp. FXe9]EKS9802170.1 hypothetical protein [Burkholderia cepacia]EKS9810945.1 hypothetical protein [Burkholderia cepacia]EKS9816473.1 hypothetical protein [Burkholderia cepacia]
MNVQTLSGTLRAQELLIVSMIRALPPDTRRALVDLYTEQIAFAEQAGLEGHGDRATHDAFITHARNLLIRIEALA